MRDMSAALMNQILDTVWPKLAIVSVAGPEGVSAPVVGVVTATEEITTVPVDEVAEEVAPVPEQFIEEPPLEIAAVWKPTPFFTRLPPQAAMIAQRLTRRMIRRSRENPISGSRTSHGGLGARDWSAGNPIAGCAAQP